MQQEITILIDPKKYSLQTIRYAAYALSGENHVLLASIKGRIAATFSPKAGGSAAGLKKNFLRELEDEKFRERLFEENRELHYWMIKRAINYVPAENKPKEEFGLTPDQEKELEQLIAQVESEIKLGKDDPKGITKTWEQKYGKKARR